MTLTTKLVLLVSRLAAGIFIIAAVYLFVQYRKGKALEKALQNGSSTDLEKLSDIKQKKRFAWIVMAVTFLIVGVFG